MKYTKQMNQVMVPELKKLFWEDTQQFIQQQEDLFTQKISKVCNEILRKKTNIILLTGPSASGKTTSARKILTELKRQGKKGGYISLDNFYLDNQHQPHWSDGSINFESIESLDVPYFHQKLLELLQTGFCEFPIFDFQLKKRSEKTFSIQYNDETFLIFEGIHALNPILCEHFSNTQVTRIYVSTHTDFLNEDKTVLVKARNLRLIRRILRDICHRNSGVEETLNLWHYVLRGEQLYIKPFRNLADVHIDSTHAYEPFLYKAQIEPLLQTIKTHEKFSLLIGTLINGEEKFEPLSEKMIPEDSLIQEFIRK